MRRLTKNQFVERAKSIHGDRYDYSKSDYTGKRNKLVIICHKHGEFLQRAGEHINGHGCPFCAFDFKRTKTRTHGASKKQSYIIWHSMMRRGLYDKSKFKSYVDVDVCEEWHDFEKFDKWFDANYRDGLQLDKDLLCKDKKIYSPETCCFLPQKINTTLHKGYGVSKRGNKYRANVYVDGKPRKRTYDTESEARIAYIQNKERHIQELAESYYNEGLISEVVYIALFNYKVERV